MLCISCIINIFHTLYIICINYIFLYPAKQILYLVKHIPESENTFSSYLVKTSATMQHKPVSINELRDAFFC